MDLNQTRGVETHTLRRQVEGHWFEVLEKAVFEPRIRGNDAAAVATSREGHPPAQRGDEVDGGWTRERLLRMDGDFVAAVEAAFRSGLESPASASACERPSAGDRGRLPVAS